MKNLYTTFAILAIALTCMSCTPAVTSVSCDRACLGDALEQYLTAVAQNDPSAAPLSAGFRQTDNSVVVRPGSGVWETVTGLGEERRYFDPISHQAGYFGIVMEGAQPVVATLRMKVSDSGDQITEAEWFVAREDSPGMNGFNEDGSPSGNFFAPDNLAANLPSDATLPEDQRLSREDLEGITNSYFDGLTKHDGSVIIAHPGCVRFENGLQTAGRVQPDGSTADCTSGLTNFSVVLVAHRSYPVIDTEKGMVLSTGVFLRKPGITTRRNVLSEWFFIEEGKIRTVHSSMFYPEVDAPVPNWSPYDGSWPVPAEFAPVAEGN